MLISAELLESRPWLPVQGWRLVAEGEPDPVTGMAECEAEDDGAPPELEGALVTPVFRHHGDGSVTVIGRDQG